MARDPAFACFSCGSEQTRVFHRADSVPVHSCLLMPTRKAAIDYPRGDLRLALCEACGFVQNSAFDPGVHEYSKHYEETQAFSPRFLEFAKELATDYVARYEPQSVLEIGCGKGEFLALLCEIGGCSGIGIDPACRPERHADSAVRARIDFIVDFYSEHYAHLAADLVLCRHTLEHIQPTREFMRMVRRAVGDRAGTGTGTGTGTVVCFELPDVERVLREQAFWDLYYEHCSYFTAGSLRALFESTGFDVVRLGQAYGDQYLLIDARPGPDRGLVRAATDDVAEVHGLVAAFEQALPARLAHWHEVLDAATRSGEKVVLWGSGSKAVAFLTTLGATAEVTCVTDVNPNRHGMFMPGSGHEIVAPTELRRVRPDLVIAMNPIYLDEIRRDLAAIGLEPRLVAL